MYAWHCLHKKKNSRSILYLVFFCSGNTQKRSVRQCYQQQGKKLIVFACSVDKNPLHFPLCISYPYFSFISLFRHVLKSDKVHILLGRRRKGSKQALYIAVMCVGGGRKRKARNARMYGCASVQFPREEREKKKRERERSRKLINGRRKKREGKRQVWNRTNIPYWCISKKEL